MSELVQKLAKGEHKVIIRSFQDNGVKELKERIDRYNYVHVKFTETRGGTELGVRLDNERTDLSKADFENGKGSVHLVGNLTLDYVKVRCVADIDLPSMEGKGHLEILEPEGVASS
ncbi:MAG TPA: MbtH domain protein [Vicinamibacteria bacterium]